MATLESLKEAIIRERQHRESLVEADVCSLIRRGEGHRAVEDLVFYTSPADLPSYLRVLEQSIRAEFSTVNQAVQEQYLCFLADLTLALRSFLPRWNLQNASRYGKAALTGPRVLAEADSVQALVVELAALPGAPTGRLLDRWQAETAARFEAEQAADPQGEAWDLVGNSVQEYLSNASAEFARSHLRRIAEMRFAGQAPTEVGNDYAAFLQYAMYIGASFVTCNPPLVDDAWAADPDRWNPVVDSIIADNPEGREDALARLVTMEVVLSNMRLLRPIFLVTEGRMGCVCLQVNPHKHDDAQAMIADALYIYDKLQDKLGGGAPRASGAACPNVVFKLPGTRAGLEACRELTRRGIGVTITVNFGLFQHLPFARAIHEGQAIFSCLVEMNGRLAYPVRDELLARLDELAAQGIDEARARRAAAWSGVAVIKRVYRLLKEKGYDLDRVKLLIASLRIYEGDGYEGLPGAFPDITEVIGANIVSVFPNIRRPFDAQPEMPLDPRRIEAPVPDDVLETLTHSEIFKQAYYVADRDHELVPQPWMPEGDERFRPDYELTLEDEAGTFAWAPVYNTLTQFCESYDRFVQRILERKQLLQGES